VLQRVLPGKTVIRSVLIPCLNDAKRSGHGVSEERKSGGKWKSCELDSLSEMFSVMEEVAGKDALFKNGWNALRKLISVIQEMLGIGTLTNK
jgi:hypothetical protein